MTTSASPPTTPTGASAPSAAASHGELAREIGLVGTVRRELARNLPHDCPPPSASVLALLRRHGEMRMTRLADLMGIDVSVASRHVAHAVEHGWIDRRPDPLDGRVRLLRLTGSGEGVLTEMHACVSRTLAHHLADWSAEDVGRLAELLSRLRTGFEDCDCRRTTRGARGVPPHPAAPRPATTDG
ncbi:MarR family transcriptional regulator [Streptomyces sp. TRM43335]|uniref:MarR family transcriptional regulator n=1 Tax=Streptomyces taklimakanensis TaxID=2569853 RepID=A0A6G2BCV4_9ACTN|nr:MarR family transcriptional regulator [Streptomyces taklimakanensis]MTE20111.1 MarR family transcriptional regulator [Streptomyces taklimakanensis]